MTAVIICLDNPVSRGADVVDGDFRFQIVHVLAEDRIWYIPFVADRWSTWVSVSSPGRFGTFPFHMGEETSQFRAWVENFVAGRTGCSGCDAGPDDECVYGCTGGDQA